MYIYFILYIYFFVATIVSVSWRLTEHQIEHIDL